ncbi:hypothetical protein ACIZ62_18215 [Acetobacterium carbinolicum]|uniref:hypothetical protein n=1 Tax=Acetobacterium carbinolicum TaxID=52690 RepID=UPI0039BF537B
MLIKFPIKSTIEARRSARSYQMLSVDQDVMDAIKAFVMPPGYQHFKWEHPNVDIGICACHVWLGLLDRGWHPTVTVSEEGGRAVWKISR